MLEQCFSNFVIQSTFYIMSLNRKTLLPSFTNIISIREISGFRREVDEIGALLRHYASYKDNSLETFRDILLVPFQGPRIPRKKRR